MKVEDEPPAEWEVDEFTILSTTTPPSNSERGSTLQQTHIGAIKNTTSSSLRSQPKQKHPIMFSRYQYVATQRVYALQVDFLIARDENDNG
jgi:hypothetical protein